MELFKVYSVFPIEIKKGKGCKVYDSHGEEYLDLYGGHAVISVGHSHPEYVRAITEQVEKLGFYSNSVINSLQAKFATRLGEACGYQDYSLFLVNSGAEANENALKLASFYNGRSKVLSFKKAFHGRTSAAVCVTDIPKYLAPVNRGMDVTFVPYGDIEAVRRELKSEQYCAVIIEGIQGIGGINVPSDEFYRELSDECRKRDTVLILDEIQSGYGRSGRFFAHQYAGIRPDLITVAKGICNGFPMSGVLISPKFKPVPGQLGTTFGGSHLACAGAIAVLDIIEKEKLIDNAAKVGSYLLEELRAIGGFEVRGRGLMIGMQFPYPIKELREKLLFEKHVFTGVAGTDTIRLLPPLCLSLPEAESFVKKFKDCLYK